MAGAWLRQKTSQKISRMGPGMHVWIIVAGLGLVLLTWFPAYHLVRQAGQNPEKALHKALAIPELSSQSYYMAFGAQTSDATVERFRKALESLQRNGSFDRLQRKWQ